MLRVSLREIFLLVAAIALVIVSMRSASNLSQCTMGLLLMLSVIAGFSTSVFGRGPRQAFAIGFTVVVCAYMLLIAFAEKIDDGHVLKRNVEMTNLGRLPTSVILRDIRSKYVREAYVEDATGIELADSDPERSTIQMNDKGNYQTKSGRILQYIELPRLENFMSIGHCWCALLLGYVGGRLSGHFYQQRTPHPAMS